MAASTPAAPKTLWPHLPRPLCAPAANAPPIAPKAAFWPICFQSKPSRFPCAIWMNSASISSAASSAASCAASRATLDSRLIRRDISERSICITAVRPAAQIPGINGAVNGFVIAQIRSAAVTAMEMRMPYLAFSTFSAYSRSAAACCWAR
ncbi:hypothetical protein [Amycolatopsis sp. M39]|uniref:hypothetical protein n=1 Tax=Amycolatopsis sp. M39 TaxID=1825094 RepID=UPI0007E1CAE0|nr:hypothetical protein [Amycolatopsis sp. M39]OAP21887.1 hypothetical protein A4R44_07345 [Amycolatopsis sp. M39]